MRICHLICDAQIVYENGAVVKTSFVTSLDKGVIARSCPELSDAVNEMVNKLKAENTKQLPKYVYPDHVLTAAMLQRYARYGVGLEIRAEDCTTIHALDAQREHKKAIYGGGLLLSEKAAAEKAAAHAWELSEREREIIAGLGRV